MKLFLSSESTVRDINKELQKIFPYLKLEFYRRKHKIEETSCWEESLSGNTLLKEIKGSFLPGMITINPLDTVAELEQRFQKNFGLPVQVYRKTRDIWLETVQTDDLTLENQNNIGASVSKPRYNIHTLFL